jgi:hypothetical protein
MTQPVGCPLPVSPAGAVCCGGLSPWPRSLVRSCWLGQPEAAGRTGIGPSPAPTTGTRWTNWTGLPTRCVIATSRQCQSTRQFLSLSSPSASPRSWPSLTVFGCCQGIFPALTTPKNCYTTMRDRGDAEAPSVPRNPNKATKPTHHPRTQPTVTWTTVTDQTNPPAQRLRTALGRGFAPMTPIPGHQTGKRSHVRREGCQAGGSRPADLAYSCSRAAPLLARRGLLGHDRAHRPRRPAP